MGSGNNTLVKLKNVGYQQNDKWLVKGESLEVEKGKIVTLIGPMVLEKVQQQKLL